MGSRRRRCPPVTGSPPAVLRDKATVERLLASGAPIPYQSSDDQGDTCQVRWKTPVALRNTSLWSEVGDGIDYYKGIAVPIQLDAVDAFGWMCFTDTDTVSDAIVMCLRFAAEFMAPSWRPKPTGVNGEVNDFPGDGNGGDGNGGDGNGVTVNPRTAQKWRTVARVAEHFAAHPGQTIRAAARELGISERHTYRIVTENLGGKP